MLFNSISYLLFLPIVFGLYWFFNKKNLQFQNCFLLFASYFFYACWDWRFLFLLLFSTGLDYFTGIQMYEAKSIRNKKIWFWLSIFVNLGFLGIFKYYNFFAESLASTLNDVGLQTNFWSLQVILPVGISFYTFHGLSYVIDIYRDRIKPEKNVISYALFVSYFPLLVAGPIERATHLLPQIKKRRKFEFQNAVDGIHQIIWGLFKKVVIADTCAVYTNSIFENYESQNSITLALGAIYFAFQIYGDFSGYSDIAIGTSKLFGINLLKNFNYPYFSRDIAEFWRRWHISLSSWFKDYLYIPLGGSKVSTIKKIRNTFIIFIVSGFWHGANWTFIFWGFLNAVYFMPLLLTNSNRKNINEIEMNTLIPKIKDILSILLTFFLTVIAWVFFRSNTILDAFNYLKRIASLNFEGGIKYLPIDRYTIELLLLIPFFVVIEWFSKTHVHPFFGKFAFAKVVVILIMIILLGVYSQASDFIYFQF
jgi:D-alanyl-lipoteichoic acid acyltransferase DltB (MBOAT superfamily)